MWATKSPRDIIEPAPIESPANNFAGPAMNDFLPADMLREIFAYLPTDDLTDRISASQTCRRWAEFAGVGLDLISRAEFDITDIDQIRFAKNNGLSKFALLQPIKKLGRFQYLPLAKAWPETLRHIDVTKMIFTDPDAAAIMLPGSGKTGIRDIMWDKWKYDPKMRFLCTGPAGYDGAAISRKYFYHKFAELAATKANIGLLLAAERGDIETMMHIVDNYTFYQTVYPRLARLIFIENGGSAETADEFLRYVYSSWKTIGGVRL